MMKNRSRHQYHEMDDLDGWVSDNGSENGGHDVETDACLGAATRDDIHVGFAAVYVTLHRCVQRLTALRLI